jgi:hypothetical protein
MTAQKNEEKKAQSCGCTTTTGASKPAPCACGESCRCGEACTCTGCTHRKG